MRHWKLLIEVGGDKEAPSPSHVVQPALDKSKAWQTLKDARSKMLEAQSKGDHSVVAQINSWIGGGLALMADLTGTSASSLLTDLTAEVPSRLANPTLTSNLVIEAEPDKGSGNVTFYPVERSRPAPPPGAPKPVKPEDLTAEERAELGMYLPGEEPTISVSDGPSVAKKTAKAVTKKATIKKQAAKKQAPKSP